MPGVLTINHKLFEGKHARDLVKPYVTTSVAFGSTMKMGPVSDEVQRSILKELNEEIDILKKSIETLSRRKSICEDRVCDLTDFPGNDDAATTQSSQDNDVVASGNDKDSEGAGNSGSDGLGDETDDDSAQTAAH